MSDGENPNSLNSQTEWYLTSEGLSNPSLEGLRGELFRFGHTTTLAASLTAPRCDVRLLPSNKIELKTQFRDPVRAENPIRMSSEFVVDTLGEFSALVSNRAASLLDRTLAYKGLVQSVRSGQTIAFVGSGLSVEVGYPDWKRLLKILVHNAGVPCTEEEI